MRVHEWALVVGSLLIAALVVVFGAQLSTQHQADIARFSSGTMGRADLAPTPEAGSTVRGMLYRVAPNGRQYPAPGVGVRLNHPQYGPSTFAYSGSDGMFYLYNVPPGAFTLEVWISNRPEDVLRFSIQVLAQQYTDIAPIRIP